MSQASQAYAGVLEHDAAREPADLAALLQEFAAERQSPRRLVVRRGPRQILVPVEDIDWIESEGNYARLHVDDKSFLIRETLTNLESKLRRPLFVRVQRSILVNLERVVEIHGDEVVLRGGQSLPLSRNYRSHLDDALERA